MGDWAAGERNGKRKSLKKEGDSAGGLGDQAFKDGPGEKDQIEMEGKVSMRPLQIMGQRGTFAWPKGGMGLRAEPFCTGGARIKKEGKVTTTTLRPRLPLKKKKRRNNGVKVSDRPLGETTEKKKKEGDGEKAGSAQWPSQQGPKKKKKQKTRKRKKEGSLPQSRNRRPPGLGWRNGTAAGQSAADRKGLNEKGEGRKKH